MEGLSGELPTKLKAAMLMPTHSLHVLGVGPNLDLMKTILFIVEVII